MVLICLFSPSAHEEHSTRTTSKKPSVRRNKTALRRKGCSFLLFLVCYMILLKTFGIVLEKHRIPYGHHSVTIPGYCRHIIWSEMNVNKFLI